MTETLPVVDWPLLRLVEEVLRDEGYEVVLLDADEPLPMLLAENNYFMAAATAVATVQDLPLAEGYLIARLSQATSSATAGPKRWDAYALMLTQQVSTGEEFESSRLFEIAYDTSTARRILQAGVKPDLASVRRAIVPFIRPPALVLGELVADPLEQLLAQLIGRGASPEVATRAVEVYRSGGNLTDAL